MAACHAPVRSCSLTFGVKSRRSGVEHQGMKTLKISMVATLASILAWELRFPHRIWPAHPYLADFLMALTLCIVLQLTWSDSKKERS